MHENFIYIVSHGLYQTTREEIRRTSVDITNNRQQHVQVKLIEPAELPEDSKALLVLTTPETKAEVLNQNIVPNPEQVIVVNDRNITRLTRQMLLVFGSIIHSYDLPTEVTAPHAHEDLNLRQDFINLVQVSIVNVLAQQERPPTLTRQQILSGMRADIQALAAKQKEKKV